MEKMITTMKKFLAKSPLLLILGLIVVSYCLLHLLSLTSLPIFADEAIYIRWTQLIIDDWQQYLFFPMNDGKTPLQFWLMVPWQFLPIDQLASARLFSVFVGILQILSMVWVTKLFGGKNKAMALTAAFTAFLPFWYFHHGAVLLDNLLTLWLTLFLGFSWLLMQNVDNSKLSKKTIYLTAATGVCFGLALLTKIPAVLAVPALSCILIFKQSRSGNTIATKLPTLSEFIQRAFYFGVSLGIGVSMFLLLKIHPAFGQLFTRGGDFLFPISQVLFEGAWKQTTPSIPNYLYSFFVYLTPSITFISISSLFIRKNQSRSHLLFWMGIIFLLPMMIMGRVVYPRYLFPAALFFTLNAALSIETVFELIQNKKLQIKQILVTVTLALLLANTASASASFIYFSIFDTNQLPLVSADKEQYLYKWSAGYGILETTELIQEIAQTQKVAVATEGSFGTLPDGIMVYLHRTDVENIFVDGIGYPLESIPMSFIENARSRSFERYILVANSDRLETSKIPLESFILLKEYCRPDETPCLQVWDFTGYQQSIDIPNLEQF
jgi:4-amino-4-deoxy-L-arabinose transferase-like glycosyltransferase